MEDFSSGNSWHLLQIVGSNQKVQPTESEDDPGIISLDQSHLLQGEDSMSYSYVFGKDVLVSDEELREKIAEGAIFRFYEESNKDGVVE